MNERKLVMAGIVTYNPDINLLKNNILAVGKQLSTIYVADNGSTNVDEVISLAQIISQTEEIEIIVEELQENLGIAAALNRIMSAGERIGYEWVLTLDQDSIVPDNIIVSNEEMLRSCKDAAVIAAVIRDRNEKHKELSREVGQTYTEIDHCITSASLTSIKIWESIGGFDEKMFIDYVDIEYCKRAKQNGYRILRNNNVVLSHAIGNIREVRILWRWVSIRNHSAFRKYYQIRNLFYMSKKLNGKIEFEVWRRILIAYFKVIFYEEDKGNKLKKMNQGLIDGLKI